MVAWGANDDGQANVSPGLGNAVAIAAGHAHSLALTAAGQVMAWGAKYAFQTITPGGLTKVVAIAARGYHNLALTADACVVAWEP